MFVPITSERNCLLRRCEHIWPLGVEEQFYSVWPGLLLVLVLLARSAASQSARRSIVFSHCRLVDLVRDPDRGQSNLGILLAADTGLGAGPGSARRGLGANHRTAETCVGATGSGFRRVGRNRPGHSAFHVGHSLPQICDNVASGRQCSTDRRRLRQPTNDCWAGPVGAANAVGSAPGPTPCIFGIGHFSSSSKSAAYSIVTSSSLRQGEGIPDKPIRIQSSREQFRPDIEGMRAIAVGLVILLHAYHKPFTGGFVGVDIFFVIWLLDHKSAAQKKQKRAGRFSISGY